MGFDYKRSTGKVIENGVERDPTPDEKVQIEQILRGAASRPTALPAPMNVQPGRATTDWQSFVSNVLAVTPGQAMKYLRNQGFNVEVDPRNKKIVVSKGPKGDKFYVNPETMDGQKAIEFMGGMLPLAAVAVLSGQPELVLGRLAMAGGVGAGMEALRQVGGAAAGVPDNISGTQIAGMGAATAAGQGASELMTGGAKLGSAVIGKVRPVAAKMTAKMANIRDVGPLQEVDILKDAMRRQATGVGSPPMVNVSREALKALSNQSRRQLIPEGTQAALLAKGSSTPSPLGDIIDSLVNDANGVKGIENQEVTRNKIRSMADNVLKKAMELRGIRGKLAKNLQAALPDLQGGILGQPVPQKIVQTGILDQAGKPVMRSVPDQEFIQRQALAKRLQDIIERTPAKHIQSIKNYLSKESKFSPVGAAYDTAFSKEAANNAYHVARLQLEATVPGVQQLNATATAKHKVFQDLRKAIGKEVGTQRQKAESFFSGLNRTVNAAEKRSDVSEFDKMFGTSLADKAQASTIGEILGGEGGMSDTGMQLAVGGGPRGAGMLKFLMGATGAGAGLGALGGGKKGAIEGGIVGGGVGLMLSSPASVVRLARISNFLANAAQGRLNQFAGRPTGLMATLADVIAQHSGQEPRTDAIGELIQATQQQPQQP